ncbi:unnamed protein product [Amoebophrya sp. A25]|nr:unnamed protein product [Amoebophrya sp. A25]|eukprot:GSA25T00007103001.1
MWASSSSSTGNANKTSYLQWASKSLFGNVLVGQSDDDEDGQHVEVEAPATTSMATLVKNSTNPTSAGASNSTSTTFKSSVSTKSKSSMSPGKRYYRSVKIQCDLDEASSVDEREDDNMFPTLEIGGKDDKSSSGKDTKSSFSTTEKFRVQLMNEELTRHQKRLQLHLAREELAQVKKEIAASGESSSGGTLGASLNPLKCLMGRDDKGGSSPTGTGSSASPATKSATASSSTTKTAMSSKAKRALELEQAVSALIKAGASDFDSSSGGKDVEANEQTKAEQKAERQAERLRYWRANPLYSAKNLVKYNRSKCDMLGIQMLLMSTPSGSSSSSSSGRPRSTTKAGHQAGVHLLPRFSDARLAELDALYEKEIFSRIMNYEDDTSTSSASSPFFSPLSKIATLDRGCANLDRGWLLFFNAFGGKYNCLHRFQQDLQNANTSSRDGKTLFMRLLVTKRFREDQALATAIQLGEDFFSSDSSVFLYGKEASSSLEDAGATALDAEGTASSGVLDEPDTSSASSSGARLSCSSPSDVPFLAPSSLDEIIYSSSSRSSTTTFRGSTTPGGGAGGREGGGTTSRTSTSTARTGTSNGVPLPPPAIWNEKRAVEAAFGQLGGGSSNLSSQDHGSPSREQDHGSLPFRSKKTLIVLEEEAVLSSKVDKGRVGGGDEDDQDDRDENVEKKVKKVLTAVEPCVVGVYNDRLNRTPIRLEDDYFPNSSFSRNSSSSSKAEEQPEAEQEESDGNSPINLLGESPINLLGMKSRTTRTSRTSQGDASGASPNEKLLAHQIVKERSQEAFSEMGRKAFDSVRLFDTSDVTPPISISAPRTRLHDTGRGRTTAAIVKVSDAGTDTVQDYLLEKHPFWRRFLRADRINYLSRATSGGAGSGGDGEVNLLGQDGGGKSGPILTLSSCSTSASGAGSSAASSSANEGPTTEEEDEESGSGLTLDLRNLPSLFSKSKSTKSKRTNPKSKRTSRGASGTLADNGTSTSSGGPPTATEILAKFLAERNPPPWSIGAEIELSRSLLRRVMSHREKLASVFLEVDGHGHGGASRRGSTSSSSCSPSKTTSNRAPGSLAVASTPSSPTTASTLLNFHHLQSNDICHVERDLETGNLIAKSTMNANDRRLLWLWQAETALDMQRQKLAQAIHADAKRKAKEKLERLRRNLTGGRGRNSNSAFRSEPATRKASPRSPSPRNSSGQTLNISGVTRTSRFGGAASASPSPDRRRLSKIEEGSDVDHSSSDVVPEKDDAVVARALLHQQERLFA